MTSLIATTLETIGRLMIFCFSSKMKKVLGLIFTSLFSLISLIGLSQTTIFLESIGTCCGTTNTSIAGTTFDNSGLTFTGDTDTRTSTASTGYAGASGSRNVFITNTIGRFFQISGINTTGFSSISLSLGHHKSTTAGNNELVIEVSPDGTTWTGLTYTRATGSGTANWALISPTGVIPSTANLRIRFRQTTSATQFRIDDVHLQGVVSAGCTAPTTQATSYSSSSVTMNSGTVNWIRGTGNNVLVIARAGSAPTGPTSGTSYTANAAYGSGDALGGGFVVYNGTGTSVNLTGLTSGTTYHIAVYEYNNTGVCYLSPALTGNFTTIAISTSSDIISAGGESVTIPSSNILAGPLTSTQGLQVWRFTVRDGGAASDADNLPTILTAFTITQNGGNAMDNWATAIQSVDIFDGATHLATGVVTANTITFSGLNIIAPDNGSKTISMRLSLNCPATGNGNVNGDDFVFQISQANVTEAVSGSSNFSAFPLAASTNGQNVFTELTTTITSISPTSGPANTLVTINATGGGFTGATAVVFNGIPAASFTVISNTQIQAVVPAGATTGDISVTDVNCYQATFSSFTVISTQTSSCEGTVIFDDIVISEVYDNSSGTLGYIEIYNGTGATVNLTTYTIARFGNIGDAAPTHSYTFPATGVGSSIADGQVLVGRIAGSATAIEDFVFGGASGFNEDDRLELMNGATLIDDFHESLVGSAGYVYRRNTTITNPNPVFDVTEWTLATTNNTSDLGNFVVSTGTVPLVTTHPTTTTLCSSESTSLTVAGTEGFPGGLGLAYQWYVSAPGAGGWTALTNSGVYSGVTTPILSISNVSGLDGYQYYCQIRENTATCYSASNAVQLDVLGTGGTNGLWTGAFSTDWCNCRNWHDGQVPTNVTNVVINQTAVNNCVVGGSCTNGVANSVSVSSSTNTNNLLTINAGSNLTISNNLTISKSAGTGSLVVSTTGTGQLVVNGSVTITGSGGTDNAVLRNESATALLDVNGSLTISTRGVLDLNPNGRLNLAGNFINNNSEVAFDQATSTVIFDGTANQSINTNAFTDVFATLTVNKASGTLTLLDPIEIVNQVNFTSGIIISSATTLLIFRDNALANTPSHTSHTNGPVRKIGNDAFTFPIGNGTFYRNIAISAPGVTTDHFTAQFFDVSPDAVDGVAVANIEVPLTNISDCEHWILDRTNGNSNVFVTLSYEDYSINNCSGVTDPVSLRVARWDAINQIWRNHGGIGIGVPTGTITTAAAVTAFSPFALATTHLNNPLPAELIHFDAVPVNKEVSVTWSTASEINVDYFEVMRSKDGFEFNTIATVDAVGNSTVLNQYSIVDAQPYMGLSYYQLNTIDNDGSSKLSDIKPVYFEGLSSTPYLSTTATNWTIFYNSSSEEPILVEIYDASGKLLQTERMNFSDAYGSVEHSNLSKGMYFIRIVDGEHSFTLKALR
jgi:hypothetical protein